MDCYLFFVHILGDSFLPFLSNSDLVFNKLVKVVGIDFHCIQQGIGFTVFRKKEHKRQERIPCHFSPAVFNGCYCTPIDNDFFTELRLRYIQSLPQRWKIARHIRNERVLLKLFHFAPSLKKFVLLIVL